MAKELPYFQFEPAQYLTGNIQFCSYELQGVFINVCAFYWQRSCEVTKEQLQRKFSERYIDELLKEDVLKVVDGKVSIDFLNEQFENITASKTRLSEAGKRGAEAKKQATLKPPLSHPTSDAEATLKQLDKIREDKIIGYNNTGYIRPKDFLESYNAIELDNLKCSTGFDEEKINLCIEQWSLSIEGSDFKYTNDKKEDYRKLIARLKKWINTWSANDAAKPPPKQTGKVNTKPTAEDYLRILTIAQNGNNAENNTD